MSKITIIDNPEMVAEIFCSATAEDFPNWDFHPFYGNYIRALLGAKNHRHKNYKVAYFVVIHGDLPLILVPAAFDKKTISMLGQPMTLGLRDQMGRKRQKQAFAAAFDHLRNIGKKNGADRIEILGSDNEIPLSAVDLACIDQRATPKPLVHGIVDLREGEDVIHSQLRSSYRSLVNWGRTNIDLTYFNAANPDRNGLNDFAKFHEKIAGNASHGPAYWGTIWREICLGRGELSLGYLADGTLVSGTLAVDAGSTACYSSGVYERNMFDKPLSYFPVYDAIIRAGSRGMSNFDLGEIYPEETSSQKEFQIGFFKKGFTSNFRLRTKWVLILSSE